MNKAECKNIYDIVIIGGGASGMMAAVSASRYLIKENIPARIAIVERHTKLGRKLLATGNGRCNLSNWDASDHASSHYYSEFPLLYETILEKFTPQKTVDFFQSIGIMCQTKEDGKVYPFCDQAYSVVEMFIKELETLGIEILTNMEVQKIEKAESTIQETCDSVNISIYSGASCNQKSQANSKENNNEKKYKNSASNIEEKRYYHSNSEENEIGEETRLSTKTAFNITCVSGGRGFDTSTSLVETTSVNIKAGIVIVATGGKASPSLSSDGLGYKLLDSLSHECTYIFPAIVQIRTQTDFVSHLAGTKWNVGVSLMRTKVTKSQEIKADREILKSDTGELLFTKYGISGPPVLQIARYLKGYEHDANNDPGTQYYAVIDYLENFTTKEVVDLLTKRINDFKNRPIHQLLVGILPFKIAIAITKKVFTHKEHLRISTITPSELALLVTQLKTFTIRITGTTGWNEAQVTAGGIRCDQINPNTLESNLCDGLYITGEVLDVDGDCGGYNLQFAWASGHVAGMNAAKLLVETTSISH